MPENLSRDAFVKWKTKLNEFILSELENKYLSLGFSCADKFVFYPQNVLPRCPNFYMLLEGMQTPKQNSLSLMQVIWGKALFAFLPCVCGSECLLFIGGAQ